MRTVTPETATFQAVALPIAEDNNRYAAECYSLTFYASVSDSKELRDASAEARRLVSDKFIESSTREDVFALVDAVYKRGEALDPESARLLEKHHEKFTQMGHGLAPAERDHLKQLKKRISDLELSFRRNLTEDTDELWFRLAELDGMPASLLESLEKDGDKVKITIKPPDTMNVQKFVKNADVRRQVFVAKERGHSANVPLFREAAVLRDEVARLLGYKNHAELKLEDKLAKDPQAVRDFLEDLRDRLTPIALEECKALLKRKGDASGRLDLWDLSFFNQMMLEQDYAVEQVKLSEYFALGPTLSGILQLFEQLFGLVFHEVVGKDRDTLSPTGNGSDLVWHVDVKMFSVWDEDGSFVGYLYTDLHPRAGKFAHAAAFSLSQGFVTDGKRHYPSTALVCNFGGPTATRPSLLKHHEVITLFHELGHALHNLVSKTLYSRLHGTWVARDFVEAPSQMLENWCWIPSVLKTLGRHYSYALQSWEGPRPAERLSDEQIAGLIKTRHVNDAIATLRQLHIGIFDMTVYSPASHDEMEQLDINTLYNTLRRDIVPVEWPESEWGHGYATHSHLIGGYDAGYYGYLR